MKKNILNLLLTFLLYCAISCTINHNDTPSIQLNYKNCNLTILDSNFIIDSVSFETDQKPTPLYTLKKLDKDVLEDRNTLSYCNQLMEYRSTGNYDSVNAIKNVVLKVFVKSKKGTQIFYSSIKYEPASDSIYVLKTIGDI